MKRWGILCHDGIFDLGFLSPKVLLPDCSICILMFIQRPDDPLLNTAARQCLGVCSMNQSALVLYVDKPNSCLDSVRVIIKTFIIDQLLLIRLNSCQQQQNFIFKLHKHCNEKHEKVGNLPNLPKPGVVDSVSSLYSIRVATM